MIALLAFGGFVLASMAAFLFFLERRRDTQQGGGDEIAHGDWPHVPSEMSSFHPVGDTDV